MHADTPHPKIQQGFTLLELLSTVAIATIVASFAIPSLESFASANQKSQATNQILSVINEARKSAVNRASKVVICPINDEASCSDDWSLPISIFADDNENQSLDYNEDLITTVELSSIANHIEWHSFSEKPYIQFDDSGVAGDQSGQLYLCSASDNQHQIIAITAAGHTRLIPQGEHLNACI